jgi:hypothetical protein
MSVGFTGCGKRHWTSKKCQGMTSQLGEKLIQTAIPNGFVTRARLQPGRNRSRINAGFSHCHTSLTQFASLSPFFTKLFSRADKANRICWALAPEGCFSRLFAIPSESFRSLSSH